MIEVEQTPALPGVYARELVELAGRFGIRPEQLLEGLEVELATLTDPAARLPLPLCAALVERARKLTGEPGLAFPFGLQMRLSSHGFLGFAAMTAGTVREALELAVRYSRTRTTAIGLSLYTEGDHASLVIEERAQLGKLREFLVIGLAVGLWQIGRDLTGQPLEGDAECAFPEPEYAQRFTELAMGHLRFDAPANRLVFPASYLDLPLKTADPVAMQLARAQCERELSALVDASGVAGRVRAELGEFRGLEEVAARLHMSTRTLKRRLADQGTTFSQVVDDLRRQRALLLLENRELSINEIAGRLGYTEAANFTRAFKRWTGKTPAAYRASLNA
jgi:AraC-like DNA-binding protein